MRSLAHSVTIEMKNQTSGQTTYIASGSDTQTRILESAAALFAARGFRGSTMRDIANAARINEVTIYRYFPAKQELCWKAVDWKMRNANVAALLIGPLTKLGSPQELLVKFCWAALELLHKEPTLARLLYFTGLELEPSERRAIFSNHMNPVLTALLVRVRSWIASGEIRQMDPETAAVGILGVVLSQVQLTELLVPEIASAKSIEQLSSEYAELCMRGLQ